MSKRTSKKSLLIAWDSHMDQKTYNMYSSLANTFDISFILPRHKSNKLIEHSDMKVYYEKTNTEFFEKIFSKSSFITKLYLKLFTKRFVNFHQYLNKADIVLTEETYRWITKQTMKNKSKHQYKHAIITWENIPFSKNNRFQYETGRIIYKTLLKMGVANNIFYEDEREYIKRHIDIFLATSERTKDALIIEGYDTNKIHVIMPPTREDIFINNSKDNNLMEIFHIKSTDMVVGTIARIVYEKGILEFIFSAYLLINKYKVENVKFLLIGTGELSSFIKRFIKMLKLDKDIIFINEPIKNTELPRYYNLIDIFTLNSLPTTFWQEQIGQVLLEAMSCKKAVIAAASGSIEEVVGDSAILTPAGDFHKLAENIKYLLDNKEIRVSYGTKGRERIIKEFTVNSWKLSMQAALLSI